VRVTSREPLPQSRVLGLTILFVAVVALVVSILLVVSTDPAQPRSTRVGESTEHVGWQSIVYRDAQVDVPGDWERMDASECGGRVDGWGPATTAACGGGEDGVVFFLESTYDPVNGPGEVLPVGGTGTVAGYEIADEVAVTAQGSAAEVRQILASVHRR